MNYLMFAIDAEGDVIPSPARFALLPVTHDTRTALLSLHQTVDQIGGKFKQPDLTVALDNLTLHEYLQDVAPDWFEWELKKAMAGGFVIVDLPDWAFSTDVPGGKPFICVPTETDTYDIQDIEEVEEYPEYGLYGISADSFGLRVHGWIGSSPAERITSPRINYVHIFDLIGPLQDN